MKFFPGHSDLRILLIAGGSFRPTRSLARLLRLFSWAFCAALIANVSVRADVVVAVASKVSKDYVRKKLPDGTFQPETYTFGKGDNLSGARVDPTIDSMNFMDILRTLAVPLAQKAYIPTSDPNTTNLLIMVCWGTTRAPEYATESNSHNLMLNANQRVENAAHMLKDAGNNGALRRAAQQYLAAADDDLLAATIGVQAENQRREDSDMKTATLLGYDSWWVATNAAMDGSPLGRRKADMKAELEEDRYYVVLTAFDYQALVKEKKSKFLWEVRFSIREHGTEFDKQLAGMVARASQYFGRDSGGLQHENLPEGKVEIGPVRSLGVVPDK